MYAEMLANVLRKYGYCCGDTLTGEESRSADAEFDAAFNDLLYMLRRVDVLNDREVLELQKEFIGNGE